MNNPLRYTYLATVATCLSLANRLPAADTAPAQPSAAAPKVAATAPAAAPAAAPAPTPTVAPLVLPRALVGVITQDEYVTYVKFQQGLRENPEIKDLSTQIRAKMNEMLELQKKSQLAQQKAVESNPAIKAIADKIKKGKPKPVTPATATSAAPAPAAVTAPAPTPATK